MLTTPVLRIPNLNKRIPPLDIPKINSHFVEIKSKFRSTKWELIFGNDIEVAPKLQFIPPPRQRRYSPYLKGRVWFDTSVKTTQLVETILLSLGINSVGILRMCSPLKIGGVPPQEGRGYDDDSYIGSTAIVLLNFYKLSFDNHGK